MPTLLWDISQNRKQNKKKLISNEVSSYSRINLRRTNVNWMASSSLSDFVDSSQWAENFIVYETLSECQIECKRLRRPEWIFIRFSNSWRNIGWACCSQISFHGYREQTANTIYSKNHCQYNYLLQQVLRLVLRVVCWNLYFPWSSNWCVTMKIMENYPLIWKKLTYLHYMYNNYCTCENLKFNKSHW